MKKRIQSVLILVTLFSLVVLTHSCRVESDVNTYLKKVLNNLSHIESAIYSSTLAGSIPGDTLKYITYSTQTEEYFNPSDTTIGSILSVVQQDATHKASWVYDGNALIFMDWNEKTITVDSFKVARHPFRPVRPPFYNYTKSIIQYALNTKDSIAVDLIDLTDTILFRLTVYGKSVEFFGKPFYNDTRYTEPLSKYDIWINKSDNLPYEYKRNLVSTISRESIEDVVFNQGNIDEFEVSKHIPDGFTLQTEKNRNDGIIDLKNKKAPELELIDPENNPFSLNNLKSKVILIQFTGIGCGFCHLSVPFLNSLIDEFKPSDLGLVAIETWNNEPEVIKRYILNNNITYHYLRATDENKRQYQISGVPAFFILDENRIIRKVIKGYSKDSTDKEIRDAINALI
jgi:thiol-disulfide isomerase/thioredoxin